MINLKEELEDFTYRERELHTTDIFQHPKRVHKFLQNPRLREVVQAISSPHEQILALAEGFWNSGYHNFLDAGEFYDPEFAKFSGHCHQCAPVLGFAIRSLCDFPVAYLEARRVREHIATTGEIEPVPAHEEPNPQMREEFARIGRIPYCCLEVETKEGVFLFSPKHIRPSIEGKLQALLRPECYIPTGGSFMRHQDDSTRSIIYLEPVIPNVNNGLDFERQIVWKKQTYKDPAPEFFATYRRMQLEE